MSGLLEEAVEALQSIETNIGTLKEETIDELKETIDDLKTQVKENSDYLSDINTALYGNGEIEKLPTYDGSIIEGKCKGIQGYQREMCIHVYAMDQELEKVIELLTNINDKLDVLIDKVK